MAANIQDFKARSPWTPLKNVSKVIVSPNKDGIDGSITVPGSKSLTNRALILAALANGKSEISGILKSDDSYWCIDALRKLGVAIEVEGDRVLVNGKGGSWDSAKLYIGAAGTVARFLPGALAVSRKGVWEVEASHSMSKRPIAPLIDALKELGADVQYASNDGHYPLVIQGKELVGGEVSMSGNTSSQFISGLLMAGPSFKAPLTVTIEDHIVQHAYVFLTLELMEKFGANTRYDSSLSRIVIEPGHYAPQNMDLEADVSTACYFLALAAVTNGRIRIDNLTSDTKQPDIKMLEVFEKMGCRVTRGDSFIELVGIEQLRGGFELSMREMSDQALTLASIAPFADGPITIREVKHIRHHESDRISAICQSLSKLGIKVEEFEDGLTVYPSTPVPATLDTHDDHRVAMSLALIGSRVAGIELNDPGCVSKTCPQYFEMLESLNLTIQRS